MPQLMIITNPKLAEKYRRHDVAEAEKAYKRFHFTEPTVLTERKGVPAGWPRIYVVIGECERFDVEKDGKVVSKTFNGKRPVLCTTSAMQDLYIYGNGPMGIPSGKAVRVDYRVPPKSGRTNWALRWWHPHDTKPHVTVAPGGGAVRVRGKGLSVTPDGIVG